MTSSSDVFKVVSDIEEEETSPRKRPKRDNNDTCGCDETHDDFSFRWNGMVFTQPIFLEDGMDFVGCEMYYLSVGS